jgi:chaperone required for assembly of F1-ATPase
MAAGAKRFYETVTVAEGEGGWGLLLDGRAVHTPARTVLRLPTAALAEALAEEWCAQGDEIVPATMPLLRLANTHQVLVAPNVAKTAQETAEFARTDLLCYRAAHPADLTARQARDWQPLLDWAAMTFEAALSVTSTIKYIDQPADAMAALRRAVEGLDAAMLTAVRAAGQVTGSLVLALALERCRIDAETAFEVSQLDESYQTGLWGEDHEAARRRENLRAEIADIARFMACLRDELPAAAVLPA